MCVYMGRDYWLSRVPVVGGWHGLCGLLSLWLELSRGWAGVEIGGENMGVGYCNMCRGVYCQG